MSLIVAMESNLSPNPSDNTNALLNQLVHIGFGNLTAAGSIPTESTLSPAASAFENPNDRICKLVHELASSIWGRTRQAVAWVLQVE
jgi:hypothetical protein